MSYSPNNAGPFPGVFSGNGSPSGTPLFPVIDGATGNITYATAAQVTALLAGGLIQTAPSAPAIALASPTYQGVSYTITPPTTGSTPLTYQVLYRVTGSGAAFTPATTSGGTATTGTLTGLAASTGYDVEVIAANGGGTATSAVRTFSTTVAPPSTTISSAVLAADGQTLTLTFSQAATITAADFSFAVAGAAVSATNTDAATSSTTHVFSLATAAASGQAVIYSATPVGATAPSLAAVVANASVTNNSTAAAARALSLGSAGTGAATSSLVISGPASSLDIQVNTLNLPTTADVVLMATYDGSNGFFLVRRSTGLLSLLFKFGGAFDTDASSIAVPSTGWLRAVLVPGSSPTITFYSGAPGAWTQAGTVQVDSGANTGTQGAGGGTVIGIIPAYNGANPAGVNVLGANVIRDGVTVLAVDFTQAAPGATSVAGTAGGPFVLSNGAVIQ